MCLTRCSERYTGVKLGRGLALANPTACREMGIKLTPTRIKGSQYLLIPKDLAQLLEIDDGCILSLTIDDSNNGKRLIYSIRERPASSTEN